MKIAIVGCGAIGGVIAARLTRAGHAVAAVTGNESIARAIAERGYRVRELDGREWSIAPSLPPRARLASGDGAFELCVAATKSTALADALAEVAPHLAPGAPVVCCQNGLPEEIAAAAVGAERVVGCVVAWGATMIEPGVYERTSRGRLQLGRFAAGSPDPASLVETFAAVAPTEVTADLAGARWSKLAINCATSTLGAIGGERLGVLLRRRAVRRLVLELWSEVAAVARASGVRLGRVGGTLSIERMALTPSERAAALGSPGLAWKHSVLLAVGMKFRRMRSSMLVALERGRKPEIDFLNGEVARRGRALGVPTPVNERLVEAVRAIEAGRARPSLAHLQQVFEDVVARADVRRLAA